MNTVKNTARTELMQKLITTKKSASPITIIAETTIALPKSHQYHGRIIKVVRVNCFINCNYERAMQRLHPNFKVQDTWGEHVDDSCIIQHEKNGIIKYYLEVRLIKPPYDEEFRLDGQVIDIHSAHFLIPEYFDKRANATFEENITVRRYSLDSIIQVTTNKKTYKLR